MTRRPRDAPRGGAAAVGEPAGHGGVVSGLGRLARVAWHEPVVVVLFLTAAFTAISGRLVDGVLLGVVAAGLAWDHARQPEHERGPPGGAVSTGPWRPLSGPAERAPAAGLPLLRTAGLVAGGILYAAVAGSFTRYSWPATVAVIGLAAVVVAIGWRGPRTPRSDPGKLAWQGAALWAGLLVAFGLWELAALFLQPSLTTTSYAHPTISALTDPLLASHLGRFVALLIWLAIGWYLERR